MLFMKAIMFKKNSLYIFVLAVFAAVALLSSKGEAAEKKPAEQVFQDSNQAYYEGQFEKAKKGYEELYERGYRSAHLLFNLGNVAYRQGELGYSVLYFSKALRILPRHPDIRANLDFVMTKRVDQIYPGLGQNILDKMFFWNHFFTVVELCWMAGALSVFFWSLVILRLFVKMEWASWLLWPLLVFYLLINTSTGIKVWEELKTQSAVVTAKVVPVRDAYLPNLKPTFEIHAGTIVKIKGFQNFSDSDRWYQIQLANGLTGWVQEKDLGKL